MISISIKSNSIVIPSEPTPSGILHLSESDQAAQWTNTPVIHIYKPNNNIIPSSFKKTKNALSRALVHFYPLAGRLHWKEGGQLELDCNAMGVPVLEAYADAKLDELGDFAPTGVVEDLVPKIDYTTPIEEWPLLVAQLARFSCGGIVLEQPYLIPWLMDYLQLTSLAHGQSWLEDAIWRTMRYHFLIELC